MRLDIIHAAPTQSDGRVDISGWWTALRRRPWLARSVALICFALLCGIIVCLPLRYSAETLIMVDSHRAPLGDFRMSQPLALVDNLALRSEIDILKSRG